MEKTLLTALLATVLTACGGDGGSSSSGTSTAMMLQSAAAPAQPFNVPATTLTAMINGMTYTVTYSATPNSGTTMFDGQAASSTVINITVQQNGMTIASDSTTEYYLPTPYTPLGISGTSGGTAYTFIVNTMNPLPSMLMVGQTGTLFSGSYMNAGSTIGTLTETYSVSAGTASALTLTIDGNGQIGGQTVTDSTVFSVDAMGHAQLQQVQVMINGQSYMFSVPM